MATLVIPNATQVSLHFTVSGQECVNVLGFTHADAIMPPDTAANAVQTAWTAVGGPHKLLHPGVVLTKVKATSLHTADGGIFEKATNVPGGSTGTLGNLATCAVVRVGAGTRSRSSKGRLYFGPLTTGDVMSDGRTFVTSGQTAVLAAFNQFKTQLSGQAMIWSVLSRKLSIATPVTNISVAGIIGIQRRRLR